MGRIMNQLTPEKAAYIAGIVDGEGCISAVHDHPDRGNSIRLELKIANTNRPLLESIQTDLGEGRIQSVKRYSSRHKPCFELRVHGEKAQRSVKQLLPFLRVKMQQAELLCSVKMREGNTHMETLQRFRELNKRGRS